MRVTTLDPGDGGVGDTRCLAQLSLRQVGVEPKVSEAIHVADYTLAHNRVKHITRRFLTHTPVCG